MQRYTKLILSTSAIVMCMMMVSAYSFVTSPEYTIYNQYSQAVSAQDTTILPPPSEMQLSQK